MRPGRKKAWRNRNKDFDNGLLLDLDFDDFGGVITFAQICCPQFDLYESHKGLGDPIAAEMAKRPKPERPKERKPYPKVSARKLADGKCHFCVPYNGHHTKNYWGNGQKDPW